MEHKILDTRHRETLKDQAQRLQSRGRKQMIAAGAFTFLTAVGTVQGIKDLNESDAFSSLPTKPAQTLLGSMWLAFAIAGGVGASVMGSRIARNQRASDRVEKALEEGRTYSLANVQTLYKKGADGRYETFGEAEKRVGFKLKAEFATAVSATLVGVVAVVDATTSQPVLTNVILPAAHDMGLAKFLATTAECVFATASFGTATMLGVAAKRHEGQLDTIEYHKNRYGENGRRIRNVKTAENALN